MKKILLLSAFLVTGSLLYAQNHDGHDHGAKETAKPAAVKTDEVLSLKQTEHDFGKIPQGKPVTYLFEIKNNGTTPLKLNNVQASCGCTTPEWDKENAIAPGATSSIKVGFNAAAEGPFNKFITITYNENQTKQVNIKGEVWKTPAASAPANEGVNDLKN
jgi:hypothetical protein